MKNFGLNLKENSTKLRFFGFRLKFELIFR